MAALGWALNLDFAGSGADAPAVVETPKRGGLTKKQKRLRRYAVEVDNEFFFFNTISEVESFLATVRETAEESAERDVTEPVTPKPPRVSVKLVSGRPTTSKTIRREVQRTQSVVNKAYIRAAKRIAQIREVDKEISRILQDKLRDEEDQIIALLL